MKPSPTSKDQAPHKPDADNLILSMRAWIDSITLLINMGQFKQALFLIPKFKDSLTDVLKMASKINSFPQNEDQWLSLTLQLPELGKLRYQRIATLLQAAEASPNAEFNFDQRSWHESFQELVHLALITNRLAYHKSQQGHAWSWLFANSRFRQRSLSLSIIFLLLGVGLYSAYWVLDPKTVALTQGQFFWQYEAHQPFSELHSLKFNVTLDSHFHDYRLELPIDKPIIRFRLDSANEEIDQLLLESIDLLDDKSRILKSFSFKRELSQEWTGMMEMKTVYLIHSLIDEELLKFLNKSDALKIKDHLGQLTQSETQMLELIEAWLPHLTPEQKQKILQKTEYPSFIPLSKDHFIESVFFLNQTAKGVSLRMRIDRRKGFWEWLTHG